MTDIGLMVRTANPVPDESQQLTDDELSAVLLLAQQRSGEMDTKQAPPVVAPEKRNRNGWLVAASAFAVVLVVVGASLLFSNDDDGPSATTPPTTEAVTPTTEAAPTTTVVSKVEQIAEPSAEQIAEVEALVEARNAYDVDGLLGLLAEDALIAHPDTRQGFSTNHEPRADEFSIEWMTDMIAFESVLNAEWSVEECDLREDEMVACTMSYTDDMVSVFGAPWTFELQTIGSPAGISWYVLMHRDGPRAIGEWAELLTYIDEQSPEDADVAGRILEDSTLSTPHWNEASGIVVAAYLRTFIRVHDRFDGVDLPPEIAAIVDGMEAAHVSGDSAAYRALHHQEFMRVNDSGSSVSLDLVVTEMESIYAMGSLIDFHGCTLRDGGFRCNYSVTGPVEDAIYAGEPFTSYMNYWVDDDGLISRIEFERISGSWASVFLTWLQVEHPEEFAAVEARHPHLHVAGDWPIWVEYAPIWAEAGRPIVTP